MVGRPVEGWGVRVLVHRLASEISRRNRVTHSAVGHFPSALRPRSLQSLPCLMPRPGDCNTPVGACRAGEEQWVTERKQVAPCYRVVETDRDVYVWVGQGSATVVNIGTGTSTTLTLKTFGTPF